MKICCCFSVAFSEHIIFISDMHILSKYKSILTVCNLCKTLYNVDLRHTHVIIWGLDRFVVMGTGAVWCWWYCKIDSLQIINLQRLASLRVMGSAKCSGQGCNSVTMYRQRSHQAMASWDSSKKIWDDAQKAKKMCPLGHRGMLQVKKTLERLTVKYFKWST